MSEIEFVKVDRTGDRGADGAPDRKKKKKGKRKWNILIAFLIVAVIGAGAAEVYLMSDSQKNKANEPYIGVLYVDGVIQSSASAGPRGSYQHDWLMKQVRNMARDANNRGIMIHVNSPGGSVYQTDELYLRLMEYKKATGRPVYFYFGEYAASGGYYIAAAGDKICSDRNTITGSIGVYMGPVYSAEKLLKRLGIEADVIKSSRNKGMGSGYEDLTPEQKAIYQSVVDEMYGRFVGVVAEGRGMTAERVRKIADGRPYTAAQAKELGLVDEICSFEETVRLMQKQEELSCPALEFRYVPPKSLYSRLFELQNSVNGLAAGISGAGSEAMKVLQFIEENDKPGFYYLMTE